MTVSFKSLLSAAALLLLVGCASTRGVCPPLVEYTDEEQTGLASEMASISPDSYVVQFLIDYRVLRQQVRACHP